ncbi:conserved hypothetical protein [Parafrankia sp. Ea1.12]|uniref:hypothetical protein n=1 Tax=Parafrankia sp. Ea1.12 TaxID=573499 RepID=UPI000DA4A00F|nr:hypothetical protein [Parafrankia sp. Ea1.12]SQD96267.1 conserved hypothetical protein [Parafrankia sp. Ea1.12]
MSVSDFGITERFEMARLLSSLAAMTVTVDDSRAEPDMLTDMAAVELLPLVRQLDRAVRDHARADYEQAVAYALLSDLNLGGSL